MVSSNNMKVIALLPMKGNSERVPNKNIRKFNGKPLLCHVLESLHQAEFVDQIIINTDSQTIADIALNTTDKVKIHERPESICGDFVSMNDVINYDLNNSNGEHYLQTHSTNPLLKVETLDRAIQDYFNMGDEFDSLFSVTKLQTRLYWESGEPINHNPLELVRTQDLPPVYEENSNFFLFSRTSFKNAGNKRIGKQPKLFEMNKIEAIDIDDENDFQIAQALQKLNI